MKTVLRTLVIVLAGGLIGYRLRVLTLAVAAAVTLAAAVVALRWMFQLHRHLPHNRVRDLRIRLKLRVHPGRGHASAYELWWRWGRLASFSESKRTRPGLSRWQRIRHPRSHSLRIGRAQYRQSVRVPVQEHVSVVGPPRGYKTALLSAGVMAAPGAVVCTSSKPDLFAITSGVRARRGPVWVFNPQGIGGIPSNVRWSPLDGCTVPATAIRRADAFAGAVSTSGTEDRAFWAGKASDGMRGIFAAAAMTGQDMRRVARWAGSNDVAAAVAILAGAGHDDWASQLAELTGPAEKTAATVRMVMSRAVAFLNDPALAAATLPAPGQEFDIDQFLLTGGTLYMLARGNGEDCVLAPLFAALATEIQHRAVQLGSAMPGRRLDPPLLMCLDEVTQICPVPLPQWLADSGGQGVLVWSAFHGFSQLRARWQDAGAQAVLDTSNVRIFLPGQADVKTLEAASDLSGQVSFRRRGGGDELYDMFPVITPGMIRQLPSGFALVIRNNLAPVIVRLARGWEHRPQRRLARRGQEVAEVTAPPVLITARPAPAVPAAGKATLILGPVPAPKPAQTNGNGNGHHSNSSAHDGPAYPWSPK